MIQSLNQMLNHSFSIQGINPAFLTISGIGTKIPLILVINKSDLKDLWEIDSLVSEELQNQGIPVVQAGAKTGIEVEQTFQLLTKKMMDK